MIPNGQTGTVVAEWKDHGCGCRTVVVKLDSGHEWAGKRSSLKAVQ